MAQRIIFLFLALPPIMRAGVLILAAGGTLDLLYHAAPAAWAMNLDHYLGAHGAGAHVVTLLGMAITLLGLPIRRASAPASTLTGPVSERRTTIEQSAPADRSYH